MKYTNTLLLTDPEYLEPENEDLLDKLLDAIRSLVPEKDGVRVSKLRFFGRVVIVFPHIEYAKQVHKLLKENDIVNHFSLRNNATSSDENSQLLERADSIGSDSSEPINSRMPTKLEPPPKTVQLKSPPNSPYLGWVNEPEDPPDKETVTDPRSLAKILFEPTEQDPKSLQKVFQEGLDEGKGCDDTNDGSESINNEMKSLDLGEGVYDEATSDSSSCEHIPILTIDREEAEHLRSVSRELEQRKSGKS